MCYKKPGPRCATHINEKMRQLSSKAHFETDEGKRMKIREEIEGLKRELLITPQGIKELENRMEKNPSDESMRKLLENSKAKRKALIELSKENDKYQESYLDVGNDRDYSSQINDLNRIKLPKDTDKIHPVGMFLVGSRLYGTHHDGSDYDYIMVYTNSQAKGHQKSKNMKHVIDEDEDVQKLSMVGLMRSLDNGSPNAIEMINSRVKMWEKDKKYKPFMDALKPNYTKAWRGQREQIKSYSDSKSEDRVEKDTRHVFRVALNGAKMNTTGTYNPTHSPRELDYLEHMVNKHKHDSPEKKVELANERMDRCYIP